MSSVRSFEAGDVDAVASLFQRLLRKSDAPAGNDLKTYLQALFLGEASRNTGLFSRVHVRADGTVSGFLGVLPVEMEFEGRRLLAANCGTFASDGRDSDPFAGARLLRDALSGPQDLSFTETSNDVSTDMWRSMRASVLAPYSLEWLRILKPATFALEAAAANFSRTPAVAFRETRRCHPLPAWRPAGMVALRAARRQGRCFRGDRGR